MTDQNCDAPGTQPAVSGAAPGGASGNGSGGAARKDDLLSLVGKIGRPDSELLDVVFDRVYTLAFQTLAPLVGEDAASEYAQDAVVEVFEKYFETGFPTLEELKLEAVKIAKKRARRGWRQDERMVSFDQDDLLERVDSGTPSPADVLLEHEKEKVVLRTVDDMPGRMRAAWQMYAEGEMSFEDLAQRCGTGLRAARNRIGRAGARILEKLNAYEELPNRKRESVRGRKRRDQGGPK